MKLLLESEVRKLLRHELKPEKYNDISEKIKGLKQVEAIPLSFIKNYKIKNASSDQNAIDTLVEGYHRFLDGGGDDGVHNV